MFFEKQDAGGIIFRNGAIHLVHVEDGKTVFQYQSEGIRCIPMVAVLFFLDQDANGNALVPRVKIEQIDGANGLFSILFNQIDHPPGLARLIHIDLRPMYELLDGMPGVGELDIAHRPYCGIVLPIIEEIDIGGFQSPQLDMIPGKRFHGVNFMQVSPNTGQDPQPGLEEDPFRPG